MKIKRIAAGVCIPIALGTGFFLVSSIPTSIMPLPHNTEALHGTKAGAKRTTTPTGDSSTPSTSTPPAQSGDFTTQKHQFSKTTPTKKVTINNKEYPLRTYRPLALPNDPSAAQWWVTQTRLDQAWDIPRGATPMTLAIIDSGFALNHEEFAGRWDNNSAESGAVASEGVSQLNCTARSLPISASCNLIDDNNDTIIDNETGAAVYENPSRLNCTAQGRSLDKSCNRIDDDDNGYIDDLRGWDFINYDNLPQAGELNPSGTGTTHGTRVAGIAAANANNAKGIAGVDWGTSILPIQALDDDSYGDTLSVGRGIYYAIARDVDVISLSLGSELPDDFVREAVHDALAAGIVVVAASGNDGCECIMYPAQYPEVVAVGALNTSNQPASFSSYGQSLDILAPGTNMISPSWQSTNQTSAYASGINGTSFATPFVGGLLTRLKSQQPTATPAQLIAALTENVNRLGLSANTPSDPRLGFGSVDAQKASGRLQTPKAGEFPHIFSPVSFGNTLLAGTVLEPSGNAFVYACDAGVVGSTPMYELKKGASHFFSASRVENFRAVTMGYTSAFVAYGCLRQPQDTNPVIHDINVYRELRDLAPKPS